LKSARQAPPGGALVERQLEKKVKKGQGVGLDLRLAKGETERRFNNMVKNRRHKHLSIICVTQKFKDASITHRANLTHFISFKPRNALEMENVYVEMIAEERKYMHDVTNGLLKKNI
jgi:hypothetical protein